MLQYLQIGNRLRSRFRRILKICGLVILGLVLTLKLPAKKEDKLFSLEKDKKETKKEKSQTPSPVAEIKFYAVENDYRPVANPQTLATYSTGEITETELFLYLLLTGKDSPALFYDYVNSTDFNLRGEMAKKIREYLQEIAYYKLLAQQRGWGLTPRTGLELKKLRVRLHPLYDYVWVDQVLKPQVKVLDEDIKLYYQQHINEFKHPEQVRVQTIYLKAPANKPLEERLKVRRKLEEIYQQIQAGEDFGELAKKYSEAKSAPQGGELPLFSRGVYPKEFEEVAFSLEPGQISMIQDFKDGFYILRCLEKIPPRDLTLEQASPHILTKLQQTQLKLRHNYELKKLLEESAPVIDTINFEFRAEDYPVVKVQKFQLTKAELLSLFPQIYKGMLLDMNYLKKVAHQVATYETIAQYCERQKLTTGNKLLELGGFFTNILLDGEAVEQEQIKTKLQISEQDERNYYEQHKAELGAADFYYLYQFVGEVKNPEKYSADEMAKQMKLLRQKIEDFLAKQKVELANKKLSLLEAALKGEQQKLAEPGALPQAQEIVNAVKALEDEQFSFSVKDMGFININDLPQIKDLVRGLTAAEFSNVSQNEQYFVWFYVADVKTELPFEKLKPVVFLRLLDERRQNAMKELREKILATANINFLF